jgi:hypothetical protein
MIRSGNSCGSVSCLLNQQLPYVGFEFGTAVIMKCLLGYNAV